MSVTIPHDGGIALLASVRGASEVNHSLFISSLTLVLIYAHGMIQRIQLAALMPKGIAQFLAAQGISFGMAVPCLRWAAVAPVGIKRL